MIEIDVAPGDLANVRFATDPLAETVSSVFSTLSAASQAIHGRLSSVMPDFDDPQVRPLIELFGCETWFPDLLGPEPVPGWTDPRDALARVRHLPSAVADADLAFVRENLPRSSAATMSREQYLDMVLTGLLRIWDVALAPMWSRLSALVEADIAYRSRQLAIHGLGAALQDLHRLVSFEQSTLRVDLPDSVRVTTAGGMWLVPTVFRWPCVAAQRDTPRPVVWYAARGAALIWDDDRSAPDAVGRLLGRSRAEVLVCSGMPATTTQIAAELGLAKGTVSEHLGALSSARLVTARRHGRAVYYERTTAGDQLLTSAAQP